MEFFTIGVYNSTETEFFTKLTDNEIDTFYDIRQRRGVRGSKYAFVNSNRLQKKMNELNIGYHHGIELAPTSEIRQFQKDVDLQEKLLKRDRNMLGDKFISSYEEKILSKFNFGIFVNKLKDIGAKKIVLFCVEEKAAACHRSIVSNKLSELGFNITHL